MEYASTVWAPYTKSNTEKLEAIQRLTARFVVSDYDYSSGITSILNQLNWFSLAIRSPFSRFVIIYKIGYQSVALDLRNSFVQHKYQRL